MSRETSIEKVDSQLIWECPVCGLSNVCEEFGIDKCTCCDNSFEVI